MPSYLSARVIVETLKSTAGNQLLSVEQIAERAKTTTEQVALVLAPILQIDDPSEARLTNSSRFELAFEAVRHGALQQVARVLTWQEFEAFSEECLQTVGFDTKKGVVVKDDHRRWQMDVIARKGSMILAVDCKHWESPGYLSKLNKAAEHQNLALHVLLHHMATRGEIDGDVRALPVILTLFEPRSPMVDGAVVVSVDQFADFLSGVSRYSLDLPFISSSSIAKSSMS